MLFGRLSETDVTCYFFYFFYFLLVCIYLCFHIQQHFYTFISTMKRAEPSRDESSLVWLGFLEAGFRAGGYCAGGFGTSGQSALNRRLRAAWERLCGCSMFCEQLSARATVWMHQLVIVVGKLTRKVEKKKYFRIICIRINNLYLYSYRV